VLGRRPLSALGIVHIFQRRALEERWHADFPALHPEGGLPGSESAGIVAFIRERPVDVGQDPRQKANSLPDLTEDGTEETVEVDLPTDNSRDENEKLVSPDTPPSRSQQSAYLVDAGYHLD
jgi:hypothetical protein